jgi:phosphatidylinositol alpha 1,6-mannosyltransferase
MRIAIITESFPPDVNGVSNCVVRVAEHLAGRGHHPLVIAPTPSPYGRGAPAASTLGYPVVRVPSLPVPGYRTFRIGLPSRRIRKALANHRTDLVHLASPFVLGARGSAVAQHMKLPMVAVYQTDIPSYARAYRYGGLGEAAAWRWIRNVHNGAELTLAPSSDSAKTLKEHGVAQVRLWGRGVDTERFDPAKRSAELRKELAPRGEVLAGYVGRLATEKRVDLLAGVAALPGVRLVITGSGPEEGALRRAIPDAIFLGARHGEELARIYASLDVFVHAGPFETFGQTLQEAGSSGVPVVAPACGGPLDLVDEGVTGYLVPPGDAAGITGAVARLAADPALRAAQGRAARAKLLSRSWTALCDELIDHYAAVLGTGTAPAGRAGVAA